jgi:hypothetical protein
MKLNKLHVVQIGFAALAFCSVEQHRENQVLANKNFDLERELIVARAKFDSLQREIQLAQNGVRVTESDSRLKMILHPDPTSIREMPQPILPNWQNNWQNRF